MIDKNFEYDEPGDCPGCSHGLMAYRYECVRWNGVVWHTECALNHADRLLGISAHILIEDGLSPAPPPAQPEAGE